MKYIDQLALNTLSIFSFKIQIYFKANITHLSLGGDVLLDNTL